jgi:hypothetical protein
MRETTGRFNAFSVDRTGVDRSWTAEGEAFTYPPRGEGGEDSAPNGTFRVGALCRHFRHYFTFGQAHGASALAVVGVSAFLGMPGIAILDWGVPWLRCGPCEARGMRRGRFSREHGVAYWCRGKGKGQAETEWLPIIAIFNQRTLRPPTPICRPALR